MMTKEADKKRDGGEGLRNGKGAARTPLHQHDRQSPDGDEGRADVCVH